MSTTYDDVMRALYDGDEVADVDAMIADPRAALTDQERTELRMSLVAALIDASGVAGGIDRVRQLAESGRPGLTSTTNDVLRAEARRVVEHDQGSEEDPGSESD